MIQLLSENPILLLFVVASFGYLIGNITIKGSSLGVAGVLFTGLAFGAIDPHLQIPEVILYMGLAIFVYSIGLSSGPAFFNSYRKSGFSDFIFIISMLVFSGLIASLLWLLFGFSAATITGTYAGSTTNTAALAGVIDLFNSTFSAEKAASLTEQIVVGYSFSYPMGVLGGMMAIILMEKFLKIDYKEEQKMLRKDYPLENDLTSTTILISNPAYCGISLRELFRQNDWNVVFGRIMQSGDLRLANWDTQFQPGDTALLVGNKDEVEEITQKLGSQSEEPLQYDRRKFDVRRIFVSNLNIVGRSIASLNIPEKYNAIITRIRRGDIDMLARGNTVLEMGDRIRFVANREDLDALSTYFGDSYTESSKINLFSFGLGIGLGLLLGMIEFSFGGQVTFKLGYAGGPLIVGLVLGALRRTGPIVWMLPYSANVTLQQIGLILLLAAIGVRSGNAFMQSLSIEGVWIFLASSIISLLTALAILFVGYKIVKKPFTLLMGMVANQPAILDFATTRSGNRIPMIGFTMMFPIAVITKIVIAQILFLFLQA